MEVHPQGGPSPCGVFRDCKLPPPPAPLTASRKSCIFVRAVAALDDPVTNHGVKQALLAVLTHEVHEARAEGL